MFPLTAAAKPRLWSNNKKKSGSHDVRGVANAPPSTTAPLSSSSSSSFYSSLAAASMNSARKRSHSLSQTHKQPPRRILPDSCSNKNNKNGRSHNNNNKNSNNNSKKRRKVGEPLVVSSARSSVQPKKEQDQPHDGPPEFSPPLPRPPSSAAVMNAMAAAAHPPRTHLIFAIDSSGSMKTRDVQKTKPNGKHVHIPRWDAVFESVNELLQEQIQQQQQNKNVADMGHCVVSLLSFNETAKTLVNQLPLIAGGDDSGRAVLAATKQAQEQEKPHAGTCFSAGMKEAERLATMTASSIQQDKVVLVFLTDGRPGDLRFQPPRFADNEPMQTTFQQHKKNTRPPVCTLIVSRPRLGTDFNCSWFVSMNKENQ